MNFKLEQPVLGALGSDAAVLQYKSFGTRAEAEEYKRQIVRRMEHYVIAKSNGAGPSGKTLAELERETEEAKLLEVVVI